MGCVVRMVVDFSLSHADFGPNNHLKDAAPFTFSSYLFQASYSADLNGHAIRDACEKLNKKLDVIKGTVHQEILT